MSVQKEQDPQATLPEPQSAPWNAELDIAFEAGAKTRLIRRKQFGPLAVQRPFYPENDGTCHVYILHPPGGVAGGDELDLTFEVGAGARCVLTTPGAAKFYRSPHRKGLQRNIFNVAAGGVCEYLPQETILFDGANPGIDTRILLDGDAMFIGWDFICLGRPAANERFNTGSLNQRIEVMRGGGRIWYERFSLHGGSHLQNAAYAFAGQPVFGTMICAGRLEGGLAERVRDALGEAATSVFSVSQLDEIVVCRYLGPQAEEGKSLFTKAWAVLRLALQSKAACSPRIWAT